MTDQTAAEAKELLEEVTQEEAKPKRAAKTRVDMTPESAEEKAARLEAEEERIAQVLSLGLVSDMITVRDGDPNKRYVFARERDEDIQKFEALGYQLETEQGKGTHGTGDTRRRVGDAVLMSCSKERYELIERVKARRLQRKMDSPTKEYKDRATRAARVEQAAPPIDLMEGKEK